ncbi:MAG: 50S ribosomal protein L35 [Nanoarchaeota archaeon]|nr:50S ribosomal protein L35 [Nanoarchaeota archaeon]
MNKAISKRIKITGGGKIKRRAMGLGHSKTNKNADQLLRKKRQRGLGFSARVINKYLK